MRYDLTPFLAFGLRGIASQCNRLFGVIRSNIAKEMFRNLMYDLFDRLQTPKKRVIAKRQIEILKMLLKCETLEWTKFAQMAAPIHKSLTKPMMALVRDINYLGSLGAVHVWRNPENQIFLRLNLDWPAQITETEFFEKTRKFSKAKPHSLAL